jgi:hypothetical protein
LPLESVTVIVIRYTPNPTGVPAAGLWTLTNFRWRVASSVTWSCARKFGT